MRTSTDLRTKITETDMKAIVNAQIVLKESIIYDGVILVEDDKVVNFGEKRDVAIPFDAQIIDAEGDYAAPGLVDLHTHAGGSSFFFEEPQQASENILKHGDNKCISSALLQHGPSGFY